MTRATRPGDDPGAVFAAFLERLRTVRVLDPACGSGNFLFVTLGALKDLEWEAIQWGSLALRRPAEFPQVGPEAVMGIELNAYAAELARVTIWIGEIQRMIRHGLGYRRSGEPLGRSPRSHSCPMTSRGTLGAASPSRNGSGARHPSPPETD